MYLKRVNVCFISKYPFLLYLCIILYVLNNFASLVWCLNTLTIIHINCIPFCIPHKYLYLDTFACTQNTKQLFFIYTYFNVTFLFVVITAKRVYFSLNCKSLEFKIFTKSFDMYVFSC